MVNEYPKVAITADGRRIIVQNKAEEGKLHSAKGTHSSTSESEIVTPSASAQDE